jgi:hypothetical protein
MVGTAKKKPWRQILMLATGRNVTVACAFFFAKYTKIQKALRGHNLLGSHDYNTSECISN